MVYFHEEIIKSHGLWGSGIFKMADFKANNASFDYFMYFSVYNDELQFVLYLWSSGVNISRYSTPI